MNAAGPAGRLVRPAVLQDAHAIAAVHVATWRDAYAGLLPDDLLDGLNVDERAETWRGRLAALPAGVFVFVFELDADVLGFVSGGPQRDAGAVGEVYAIYVDPGSQGRGAGRQLLQAAVDCLTRAGFTEARLWVLAGNHPARRFYESQGWQPDGTEQPWAYPGAGEGLTEVRYVADLRTPGSADRS